MWDRRLKDLSAKATTRCEDVEAIDRGGKLQQVNRKNITKNHKII